MELLFGSKLEHLKSGTFLEDFSLAILILFQVLPKSGVFTTFFLPVQVKKTFSTSRFATKKYAIPSCTRTIRLQDII